MSGKLTSVLYRPRSPSSSYDSTSTAIEASEADYHNLIRRHAFTTHHCHFRVYFSEQARTNTKNGLSQLGVTAKDFSNVSKDLETRDST